MPVILFWHALSADRRESCASPAARRTRSRETRNDGPGAIEPRARLALPLRMPSLAFPSSVLRPLQNLWLTCEPMRLRYGRPTALDCEDRQRLRGQAPEYACTSGISR